MRHFALVVAVGLASILTASAQQTTTQYITRVRILAATNDGLEVVAEPTFRTSEGREGTLSLSAPTAANSSWVVLFVTPEPLNDKILLHVVAGSGAQPNAVKFDLLSGVSVVTPTVALRSDDGQWLTDRNGRQLFAQFKSDVTRR